MCTHTHTHTHTHINRFLGPELNAGYSFVQMLVRNLLGKTFNLHVVQFLSCVSISLVHLDFNIKCARKPLASTVVGSVCVD